nr:hypothetical protein [Tanacetum cinerariifolium]
ELEENLVAYSPDFQNTFELSNASTNVVNAPREPYVVEQDNRSFVDKIIFRALDSPDQFHCFHCKDVLRAGEACKQCTCIKCRSGLGKGLCYIRGHNQNSLNDSPSLSETSSQSPPNINHCCYECGDPLDGIFCKRCTSESPFTLDSTPTYVNESPNVFNPHPQPPVSEVMEIVIPEVGEIGDDILLPINNDDLREKLRNVNLIISKIEALNANPTPSSDCKTKSSSTSLNSLLEETNTFDNSLPEFETFCFDVEEISSGSTTISPDISLLDMKLSMTIMLKSSVVAVPLIILILLFMLRSLMPRFNSILRAFASLGHDIGNSYVYDPNPNSFDCPPDSYYPPYPIYKTYSYDSYGNDSQFGYDCQPQFSLNYESEPGYIETYTFYPYDSLSSLVIHQPPQELSIQEMEDLKQQYLDELKCLSNLEYHDEIKIAEPKENFNGMSIEIRKKEKLQQLEQWAYLSTYPSKRLNSFCYDDDNDDEDYTIAVTPSFPIEEPDNSLSMGDEHLNTIPATESDEVIKSSVENLIPIPKFYSLDDDSFSIDNIDYVEASPPDSELVSSEVMEIVIPETKSSSTSLNSLLEETNTFDNSLPEFETFCFEVEEICSGNTTTHFDISLLEYEVFHDDHVKEISCGNPTTHYDSSLYASFIFDLSINPFPPSDSSDFYEFADELIPFISLPKYDCFLFNVEPNSRDFTMDVVDDISPTKEPQVYNALPTHPTLQLNLKFQPSSDYLFTYVVWIFLPFLVYSVSPHYLLSLRNEDTFLIPAFAFLIFLVRMYLIEAFLNDDHSSNFKTKSSSTSLNSLLEETKNFDNSLPEFTTFLNVLFDAEYEFDSNEFAGELTFLKLIPLGIDETDCDFEEDICLIEKLLYDNSSPRPLEEFVSANSDAEIKSFSPSPILVKDSDSLIEEIDLSCTPDYPMSPGIEDDDYDSERDILILKDLPSNNTLSFAKKESFHFDIPLFSHPSTKPPDGNTGILNIKMMGDISNQKDFMHKLMITIVPHHEKSPDLLSHQGLKAFQPFATCSMMIHGKNNPILDVPLFHLYPP